MPLLQLCYLCCNRIISWWRILRNSRENIESCGHPSVSHSLLLRCYSLYFVSALHSTSLLALACKHPRKNCPIPSCPCFCSLSRIAAAPLSLFCPPFYLTLTFDRPAMWDSHYCPSLLSHLTPPSHPLPSLLSLFFLPPPRTFLLSPPSSTTPPPHTENDQPSLVWFDRGKFYLTFEGKLSLHQASVHTHSFWGSFVQASPLPCPAPSFLPLLLFLPCYPSINLTCTMLTPGISPSYAGNSTLGSSSLLPSPSDLVHCHFLCADCFSFFASRIINLQVLISVSSLLSFGSWFELWTAWTVILPD